MKNRAKGTVDECIAWRDFFSGKTIRDSKEAIKKLPPGEQEQIWENIEAMWRGAAGNVFGKPGSPGGSPAGGHSENYGYPNK